MEVRTKRKLRLLELIELEGGRRRGGVKKVAEKVGTDPAYLSQLVSDRTTANMGDNVARRIELAYNKSVGWIDTYYSDKTIEQIIWIYEHAPDEGKRFIESTCEAVRIRYLNENNTTIK